MRIWIWRVNVGICLVLLLLLSVGSLVQKFHFQLAKIKKAEKFGKWSDMVHIAADDMTALAQLRVLYSYRVRSFNQRQRALYSNFIIISK